MVRHGKVEPRAEVAANEALQLAQQIGDESGISNAYATLGMIAQAGGKLDEEFQRGGMVGVGVVEQGIYPGSDCDYRLSQLCYLLDADDVAEQRGQLVLAARIVASDRRVV